MQVGCWHEQRRESCPRLCQKHDRQQPEGDSSLRRESRRADALLRRCDDQVKLAISRIARYNKNGKLWAVDKIFHRPKPMKET